jgi:hypothetical protein
VTPAIDLLRAIRTGRLHEVRAVLDAGAPVELLDGRGDPGLPLGVACFMGYADIVRELVRRGAKVNTADTALSGNGPGSAPLTAPTRLAPTTRERTVTRADDANEYSPATSGHPVIHGGGVATAAAAAATGLT